MKTIKNGYLIFLFFALVQRAHALGFVNLDFEDATIVPDPSSPYYPYAVYANDAIPGWTATGFIGPNDILYNGSSLGSTSVSILGTDGFPPALDGNFSIYLYGGDTASSASISQTAMVPASAQSILFWSQDNGQPAGTLLVSLGGQNVSFFALASGPNRTTLYGGNISFSLAGQSEQLIFSALEGNNNAWEIDDIQFSPSSVPEPSVLGLFALGGLFFGLRRQRNQRNLSQG